MDVRNCRQCGKLYNYIGGSYRNLCPSCIKQLEDKFMEIKEYIRDNKVASISEISDKFEVSTKQIEQWVREERLCFTDRSGCSVSAVVQRLRQGVTVISAKERWQTSWIICIRHRQRLRHQGQAGIVTMQE